LVLWQLTILFILQDQTNSIIMKKQLLFLLVLALPYCAFCQVKDITGFDTLPFGSDLTYVKKFLASIDPKAEGELQKTLGKADSTLMFASTSVHFGGLNGSMNFFMSNGKFTDCMYFAAANDGVKELNWLVKHFNDQYGKGEKNNEYAEPYTGEEANAVISHTWTRKSGEIRLSFNKMTRRIRLVISRKVS